MYVQGVSTRKVKAVTEELCGHTFSASTVSRINKSLDGLLRRFAHRRLDEAYPYLILDARYEKVRLDGVIQSQAVFIAIGINGEGRRQILGGELSNRESRSSWTTFVTSLQTRGLHGVEFVVSDDHAGLKRAVRELLPEAVWQRCYVHFLRNALDYLPRNRARQGRASAVGHHPTPKWVFRDRLTRVRRELSRRRDEHDLYRGTPGYVLADPGHSARQPLANPLTARAYQSAEPLGRQDRAARLAARRRISRAHSRAGRRAFTVATTGKPPEDQDSERYRMGSIRSTAPSDSSVRT